MVELKEIKDIPFAPKFDPEMPVDIEESKRGVLCVLYTPYLGVSTIRVDANIMKIMDALGLITHMPHFLKFYEVGNKMLIMNTECGKTEEDVFTYNGESVDMKGSSMLICNKDFESLTQMEAIEILSSARLLVAPNGLNMRVCINIKD